MTLTAGDVLIRCGIDVAEVRRILPRVDPFFVSVRVAPRWFRALWPKGIVAVAMPWAVYVVEDVHRDLASGTDSTRRGPLMVHELTHLEQYRRQGPLRHVTRYLGDYLGGRLRGKRHWDAYRDIAVEEEARQVASRFREGPLSG